MTISLAKSHKPLGLSLKVHARAQTRRYNSSKTSDPLRILFCGSDDFSIASLRAVHQEHVKNPGLIASIDVVCKPGKPVGRGLKSIREGKSKRKGCGDEAEFQRVPIKAAAEELSLPIHQINTFTGWLLPRSNNESINLIVAVSFGLFVPKRILNAAKYGGLNVHPSMLPDLRGPAPLHHTLLQGRDRIGVTLQTLHPIHFDHGNILAQTPYPGDPLPFSEEGQEMERLVDFVAPKGADMLVRGLKDCVFVPPLEEVGWASQHPDLVKAIRHAPMITAKDRHIDWSSWDSETILRRQRVIGPMWSMFYRPEYPEHRSRIKFNSISRLEDSTESSGAPGELFAGAKEGEETQALCIWTRDGKALRLEEVTIEGKPPGPGNSILRHLRRGKMKFRCA